METIFLAVLNMSKSFQSVFFFFSFSSSIILSNSNQWAQILSNGFAIFKFWTLGDWTLYNLVLGNHFGPKGFSSQTMCLELDPENKIPCTQSAHCLPDNTAITVLARTLKPAFTVLEGQGCTTISNGKLLGFISRGLQLRCLGQFLQ